MAAQISLRLQLSSGGSSTVSLPTTSTPSDLLAAAAAVGVPIDRVEKILFSDRPYPPRFVELPLGSTQSLAGIGVKPSSTLQVQLATEPPATAKKGRGVKPKITGSGRRLGDASEPDSAGAGPGLEVSALPGSSAAIRGSAPSSDGAIYTLADAGSSSSAPTRMLPMPTL